ncbi:hypothetical protein LYNGBM3L_62490 [Moorena producens 3L]|uniref:Uncharacterized protein n=1 Tax=Moorena producens 3L TaxID=489825 RepID=F4Y160_9CYAN|nr:hypothetical protein LYNGBM3L_62490 [Moorena producens 3L]
MKQNLIEGKVSSQLTRLTIPMIWGVFAVIRILTTENSVTKRAEMKVDSGLTRLLAF